MGCAGAGSSPVSSFNCSELSTWNSGARTGVLQYQGVGSPDDLTNVVHRRALSPRSYAGRGSRWCRRRDRLRAPRRAPEQVDYSGGDVRDLGRGTFCRPALGASSLTALGEYLSNGSLLGDAACHAGLAGDLRRCCAGAAEAEAGVMVSHRSCGFMAPHRRRAPDRRASQTHILGRMKRLPLVLLIAIALGLVITGIAPYDRTTWWLEIFPILIGAPILIATYRRFPLTRLAYTLLAIHAVILMVGGYYTYARVPLGFLVEHTFGLARNDYDRLGHFAQGFVPAILAREILLRTSPLRPGRWLFVIVTALCLAISACYEFIEWWSALLFGQGAEAFLGTQGDVWDTQWDMLMTLIGAIVAQLLLSNVHNRAVRQLMNQQQPGSQPSEAHA